MTPINAVVVSRRRPGRWLVAALAILTVGLIVRTAAAGNIQWPVVGQFLFDREILHGVWRTIIYTVLSMSIGIVGGIGVGLTRIYGNPVVRAIAGGYIWVLRSLPLLVLLLIFFNIALFLPALTIGIPGTNLNITFVTNQVISPFLAAVLALSLHEVAYMAEVVRAGILSVPEGQTQAARALGMPAHKRMRHIVLPQAMRIIVPPTLNQFISMLKNTSILIVVSARDLMSVASQIYAQNFLTMELLFVTAAWYLALTFIASLAARAAERTLSKGAR